MPEIVTCPNCTRKLRVPEDLVGKTVKCPECKQAFLAQTESVSKSGDEPDEPPTRKRDGREVGVSTGPRGSDSKRAPMPSLRRDEEGDEDHPSRPEDDLDDDYADRPRGRTSARAGWQRVRLGLNLMIWGIYVTIAAIVLFLLSLAVGALLAGASAFSAFSALGASNPNAGNAGAAGAGAALIAAMVVVFVGYGVVIIAALAKLILDGIAHVFYLWIPDRPGTARRTLAIAALSLWGAQLLLPLFSCGLQCAGGMSRNSSLMTVFGLAANCSNLISGLCGLAWFFVFMFFLRAVALGVGNSGLARTIVIYMITVPVWFALAFLSIVAVVCLGGMATVGFASRSSSAGSAAGIGTGFLIAVIAVYGLVVLISFALWIWYIVILHQARGAISERLAN